MSAEGGHHKQDRIGKTRSRHNGESRTQRPRLRVHVEAAWIRAACVCVAHALRAWGPHLRSAWATPCAIRMQTALETSLSPTRVQAEPGHGLFSRLRRV